MTPILLTPRPTTKPTGVPLAGSSRWARERVWHGDRHTELELAGMYDFIGWIQFGSVCLPAFLETFIDPSVGLVGPLCDEIPRDLGSPECRDYMRVGPTS